MAQARAKVGTKVEDSQVDKSKRQALKTTPPKTAEIEGQDYLDLQICPWCGAVGYGWEDETIYRLFECHNCGRSFRA